MKVISNLAILSLLAQTQAFAPSMPLSSSRFIGTRNVEHRVASGSALNMNLFDRFARVAKANANNILKNLEDPEKILNQAVEDMQVRYVFV